MNSAKTYRASRNIAANYKSCPACQGRIQVGQPIIFAASRFSRLGEMPSGKSVAHHASCAPSTINLPDAQRKD